MARHDQFFFVLFSLCRFSINLGLLERPLVIAGFCALATGEATLCLGIGAFFELLWLDLFPAGTFIPPNSAAATLVAIAIADRLHLRLPAEALLPISAGVVAAYLGKRLEQALRERQNKPFNELLQYARKPSAMYHPEQQILRGLGMAAASQYVFFLLMLAGGYAVCDLLRIDFSGSSRTLALSWPHVWLTAAIGGILSLRWPRAYMLLAGAVCTVAVAVILPRFF